MPDVEFTKQGHIVTVRLNRPQSMNAITQEMDEQLCAAWNEINANDDVWPLSWPPRVKRPFALERTSQREPSARAAWRLAGLTGIGGPLVTCKKSMIAAV